MSDERTRSIWPWIVALLIGLPVMYVLSSGPAQMAAPHLEIVRGPDMDAEVRDPGEWWYDAFAPLCWIAGESWGDALNWYWDQFPAREMLVLRGFLDLDNRDCDVVSCGSECPTPLRKATQ